VQHRPAGLLHALLKHIRSVVLAGRDEKRPLGLVVHRQLGLQPRVIDPLLDAQRDAL
jgi:hypothetical protein